MRRTDHAFTDRWSTSRNIVQSPLTRTIRRARAGSDAPPIHPNHSPRSPLRVLRLLLIVIGLLGGAWLSYVWGSGRILSVIVESGYGALAGWAVGAIVAHVAGER